MASPHRARVRIRRVSPGAGRAAAVGDGQEVPLPEKAFEVLVALVSAAPTTWCRRRICSTKCGRARSLEEANLSYTVSLLRKALQDRSEQRALHRYRSEAWVSIHSRRPDALRRTAQRRNRYRHRSECPQRRTSHPQLRHSRMLRGRHRAFEDRRRWGAVTAIGCAGGYRGRGPAKINREITPQARARFDETVADHITLTPLDQPVISPDGRRVAFTGLSGGTRHLLVRLPDSSILLLPGATEERFVRSSPDSRSVAFFADRRVKRMTLEVAR